MNLSITPINNSPLQTNSFKGKKQVIQNVIPKAIETVPQKGAKKGLKAIFASILAFFGVGNAKKTSSAGDRVELSQAKPNKDEPKINQPKTSNVENLQNEWLETLNKCEENENLINTIESNLKTIKKEIANFEDDIKMYTEIDNNGQGDTKLKEHIYGLRYKINQLKSKSESETNKYYEIKHQLCKLQEKLRVIELKTAFLEMSNSKPDTNFLKQFENTIPQRTYLKYSMSENGCQCDLVIAPYTDNTMIYYGENTSDEKKEVLTINVDVDKEPFIEPTVPEKIKGYSYSKYGKENIAVISDYVFDQRYYDGSEIHEYRILLKNGEIKTANLDMMGLCDKFGLDY